jgi:hypothetical protein
MLRVLLGCLIGLVLAGGAVTARPAAPSFWVPAWAPPPGGWAVDGRATHRPGAGGPVWAARTARLPEHTGVQLCGRVRGVGQVTLIYGQEGDPVALTAPTPTFTCVQTFLPGGSATNLDLAVYLRAADGQTLTWAEPTLLVQVTP